MTYKLAYSYALPVKGEKNFHMLIQIMAKQSNYQKKNVRAVCLTDLNRKSVPLSLYLRLSVCLLQSKSNLIRFSNFCKSKHCVTQCKDTGTMKNNNVQYIPFHSFAALYYRTPFVILEEATDACLLCP